MTEVECPVDGCDYQDAVRSVKAHITASKDGEHDGMHGMDVADSLREQAESRLNGELPGLEDAVDEARDAVADAADGVLTRPGSEPDEPDEPEQATAGPEPGEEPGEPEVEPVEEIGTDGTNGIPVPVDSNYIVIGVALVVVLVVYSRSSSSGSTAKVDDTDSGASESNGAASRGLI